MDSVNIPKDLPIYKFIFFSRTTFIAKQDAVQARKTIMQVSMSAMWRRYKIQHKTSRDVSFRKYKFKHQKTGKSHTIANISVLLQNASSRCITPTDDLKYYNSGKM